MEQNLNNAWATQAQLDADRGIIECRICKQRHGLDKTITLWRNGSLVFAVCDGCSVSHDILMHPIQQGIQVKAKQRAPIVIGGHQ